MNKIFLLAAIMFFSFGGVVSAATYLPGSGAYNVSDGVCRSSEDSPVYEFVGNKQVITSCLEKSAVEQAKADALARMQDDAIVVPRGSIVLLINGLRDVCPLWFPSHMNCVLSPDLFVRFLSQ